MRRWFLRGKRGSARCCVAVKGVGRMPSRAHAGSPGTCGVVRLVRRCLRCRAGAVHRLRPARAACRCHPLGSWQGFGGRLRSPMRARDAPETTRSRPSKIVRQAHTQGAPNATALGADGELYVTQNGGIIGPWRADHQVEPSIQRISPTGEIEFSINTVDGQRLKAPNDLAFGPDGRLYFTDPAASSTRSLNQSQAAYSPSTPTAPGNFSRTCLSDISQRDRRRGRRRCCLGGVLHTRRAPPAH